MAHYDACTCGQRKRSRAMQCWACHVKIKRAPLPLADRFWRHVEKADGCWHWTGSRGSRGYGQIGDRGRTLMAHRVAYELLVGPIPHGFHVDHLCRNTGCVNPAHLEAVTPEENRRRQAMVIPASAAVVLAALTDGPKRLRDIAALFPRRFPANVLRLLRSLMRLGLIERTGRGVYALKSPLDRSST